MRTRHGALIVALGLIFNGCSTTKSAAEGSATGVARPRPELRQPSSVNDRGDAGNDLPETWTPVTIPAQDTLQWRIISKDVPAHYESSDFDAHKGDYRRVEEPKTVRYWQAFDPNTPAPDAAAMAMAEHEARALEPLHGAGCPAGMVRVKGRMKDFDLVTAIQDQSCKTGPDKKAWNATELCYRYDLGEFERKYAERSDALRKKGKTLKEKDLDFCIDRYEYPNVKGAYPVIMVNWFDARSVCEADGKRLCSEDEWTFSCEGEEAWPYPTGDVKDPTACEFDRVRHSKLNEAVVEEFDTPAAQKMIAGLFGAVPSGSMDKCRSSFGVHDLTGNVDEWTTWTAPGRPRDMSVNHGRGWLSMLKGGFWGPVRNRCQPSTSSHEPGFRFYQQGFRCCSDSIN